MRINHKDYSGWFPFCLEPHESEADAPAAPVATGDDFYPIELTVAQAMRWFWQVRSFVQGLTVESGPDTYTEDVLDPAAASYPSEAISLESALACAHDGLAYSGQRTGSMVPNPSAGEDSQRTIINSLFAQAIVNEARLQANLSAKAQAQIWTYGDGEVRIRPLVLIAGYIFIGAFYDNWYSSIESTLIAPPGMAVYEATLKLSAADRLEDGTISNTEISVPLYFIDSDPGPDYDLELVLAPSLNPALDDAWWPYADPEGATPLFDDATGAQLVSSLLPYLP